METINFRPEELLKQELQGNTTEKCEFIHHQNGGTLETTLYLGGMQVYRWMSNMLDEESFEQAAKRAETKVLAALAKDNLKDDYPGLFK